MPLIHFATALMAVVDFILFHAVAVGLTIAIYFGIPQLDDAISQSAAEWSWLGIFKIVGPTVTVPGGAVTVLSAYFYARRLQESEEQRQEEAQARQEEARLRQEAERERQESEEQRQEEARRRQEAEAQVETLKAQLEQATTPPRRNRRRLRNGPSRRGR
ncbi:MAG: hypothetical protein OXL37_12860 [Chloroflexota bacterium]|nr:hypothetical protein [Chloroflexota bacterium]MDE2960133.1 hypothetical protein [Chloroflexota bacterium]